MLIRLARAWGGALPVPGGLLDQPLGLMVAGQQLSEYADAFHAEKQAEREGVPVPSWARELVAKVRAMSAIAADRGE